jgi:hypothetical protein
VVAVLTRWRSGLGACLGGIPGSYDSPSWRGRLLLVEVDRVCLNREDHDEKAHQVPNTGEIYASAARTLVWLGEDGDNSDVAMKYLKDVHDMLRTGKKLLMLKVIQEIV